MLVLTRKVGEQIRIGEEIVVTLVRIQGDKVRLGIDAPREIPIHREEVRRRLKAGRMIVPPLQEDRPTGPAHGMSGSGW
jgi:carbon storage regulator